MVSRCECLINVDKRNKLKAWAAGLGQKGNGVGIGAVAIPYHGHPTLPADRADLTGRVVHEERGKPDAPPFRGRRTVRGAVGAAGRGW
jgi:hypothetical protein